MQGPTYRPSSPCASLKMLLLAGLAALLLPPLANCDPGAGAMWPMQGTVECQGGPLRLLQTNCAYGCLRVTTMFTSQKSLADLAPR